MLLLDNLIKLVFVFNFRFKKQKLTNNQPLDNGKTLAVLASYRNSDQLLFCGLFNRLLSTADLRKRYLLFIYGG